MLGVKRKRPATTPERQHNTLLSYNQPPIKWTCDICTYINTDTTRSATHKCSLCDHVQSSSRSTQQAAVSTVIESKAQLFASQQQPIVLGDSPEPPIDIKSRTKAEPLSNVVQPTLQQHILADDKSSSSPPVAVSQSVLSNKPIQLHKLLGDDALYHTHFITPAEHDFIVQELDKYKWMHADGSVRPRRMQLYGIFADSTGCGYYKGKGAPNAFPVCLKPVFERLIQRGVYSADDAPSTMIIQEYRNTEYGPESLGAHIDNPFFGNIVADISLMTTCIIRWNQTNMPSHYSTVPQYVEFHKNAYEQWGGFHGKHIIKGGQSFDHVLEKDSLLVFKDKARWKWLHGVPKVTRARPGGNTYRRVSLTFRTVLNRQQPFEKIKWLEAPAQVVTT